MSKSHLTVVQYCLKLNTCSMNYTVPYQTYFPKQTEEGTLEGQSTIEMFLIVLLESFLLYLQNGSKTDRKLKSYLFLSTVLVKASHGRSGSHRSHSR